MPRYTYTCSTEHSITLDRKIAERDAPVECEACHSKMERRLPKIQPTSVMEKKDSYRNISQRENNTERIRARAKKFFMENEVKELVAEHGVETAKRSGWVKADGKVITKEDLK
jgi:predicted nucleic acid-binding Zn ribbon protein